MTRELAVLAWTWRWPLTTLVLFSTRQPEPGPYVIAQAAACLLLTTVLATASRAIRRLILAERHHPALISNRR